VNLFFLQQNLLYIPHGHLVLLKPFNTWYLIAYSNFLKRKRFKGLEQELPIGSRIRISSKLYMYVYFFAAFIGVSWLILLALALVIANW